MNHIVSVNRQPLHQAAELLSAAHKPILVLGYGAVIAGAARHARRLAARLPNLRVVASPRAKGVFPEQHPQYRGVIGFAGHRAAQCLFDDCDLAIVVGTRLGELTSDNWDTRWTQLKLIRVDVVPAAELWPKDACCSLQGDAGLLLSTLLHKLAKLRLAPNNRVAPVTYAETSLELVPELTSEQRLTPREVMQALNDVCPSDAHIFSGIGNSMAWGIHYLRRRVSNTWHVNLNSGAMGHAIPAAMGASVLGPTTFAVLGDAEFLMTGCELHTATELALPVVVLVLNDQGHGMVRAGIAAHCAGAAPSGDFSQPAELVRLSRALGTYAQTVFSGAQLRNELQAALRRRGPSVLEIPIARNLLPPMGERLRALSQAFGASNPGDSHV